MSEEKTYVIDTNSLINNPHIIKKKNVIITSLVLREFENLEKRKNDRVLQYNIRVAKRVVERMIDDVDYDIDIVDIDNGNGLNGYDDDYVDNKLIQFALSEGYGIISDDILLKHKAMSKGIEVISSVEGMDNDEYEGVREFFYDSRNDEDLELMEEIQISANSKLREYINPNPLNMKTNEYLIIWDIGSPTHKKDDDGNTIITGYKEIGTYRFNGEYLDRLRFKNVDGGNMYGEIKPINVRQRLAFDLLQNRDITVKSLLGVFGSGKDHLMLSHAIDLVNKGEFQKIIWVRNNIEVKDSNSIGFLPDGIEDKLKPFLAPLQDFLGGEDGLNRFLMNELIEVQHLGFIRGRDIRNSIIYVTECQSNTSEHVKLLISRVGEGSEIWFNGDDQQTDGRKFEYNNGVKALKKLSGNKLYGQVTMDKTERSDTAELASVLDEL